MRPPVILVVDDDPQVLGAIRRDLRSRYREDYRVLAAGSGESALKTIRELKARGDELAIVISDQRMPGMLGVDLLTRVREIYPVARRALLTAYSDIKAAIRAINEAQVDHYLDKPWDPPEEKLFPPIDDLLEGWHAEHRPDASGIRLVGLQWSPQSHAVKNFLAGNLIPYRWLELGRDPEAARLLDASQSGSDRLPAVFLEDGTALANPTLEQLAEHLDLSTKPAHDLYDLIIVGAGPAGLAAAVYGASEGIRTLLLDGYGPGGQAGTSSRIENYLGFPSGVSGSELTRRAVAQAKRLGAEFLVPVQAVGLAAESGYKRLTLNDGRTLLCRSVIAATGMTYREHPADGISELSGAGVYYGGAITEAKSCRGRRIMILGGGNSAGQGAVYLSRYAEEVVIAVRRDALSATMSQYLVHQIERIPNIRVMPRIILERVEGREHLERAHLRSLDDDACRVHEVDAVFVFIGTRPHSDWLPEIVLRDPKGFVVTGRDASLARSFARIWKEPREPMPLETSVAGVFAAGDLRAGAMNRVASAVGEGSMAVRLVSDYLAWN